MSRAHLGAANGPAGAGADSAVWPQRGMYRRPLLAAISITAGVLAIEVIGGIAANSLALLSDAGHVLTDLLALVFSYTALAIAGRPASRRRSFGFYRVEILAALFNGVILILVAGAVLRESWLRFSTPKPIGAEVMAATALVGLLGNLAAMAILARARENLNVRGAFLHVLGDTLSSVAVLAAAVIVVATGWTRADAITGALIGVVIVIGAIRLLKESVDILLEACPIGIDSDLVEERMRSLPEVATVHDLHIWSITSDMHALSGHVVLRTGPHSTDDILARLQLLLRDEFQIAHTTLQIETEAFEEIGPIH